MYFITIILVNFICIDGGSTANPIDVDPSKRVVEGFGDFVKKQIPEEYKPILEPAVDVATQTINTHIKDQDPVKMAKSFYNNVAQYMKQSMPTTQCVQETLLSPNYAIGITAMELGVAYILISDAAVSRKKMDEKLEQLNQTRDDFYADSRITNCAGNNTINCNATDFNLAKNQASRNIESIIKDIQRDIDYKSTVMIPGGIIATAGGAGLAGYAIYSSGFSISSVLYSIGTGFMGYGAVQQIITYGELKDVIKKLKKVLEEVLEEEQNKLANSINNVPSTL